MENRRKKQIEQLQNQYCGFESSQESIESLMQSQVSEVLALLVAPWTS